MTNERARKRREELRRRAATGGYYGSMITLDKLDIADEMAELLTRLQMGHAILVSRRDDVLRRWREKEAADV